MGKAKKVILATTVGVAVAVALALALSKSARGWWLFERFERGAAVSADTFGAQHALEARVPVGSKPGAYIGLFKSIGGRCDGLPEASNSYHMRCGYSHGFLVRAEWIVVVRFDSDTDLSDGISVGFGLTGL